MIEIKANSELFVICDTEKYDSEHVLQIVTKAKELADNYGKCVTVLCIGQYNKNYFDEIAKYGANVIICKQDKLPDIGNFCDIASEIITLRNPSIILYPASVFGKSAAAILSTRFESGLTADCIDIEATENGDIYFSRAAINDSVIAKIKCINCSIMMGTIKKDVFIKKEYLHSFEGKIEEFKYSKTRKVNDFSEILNSVKCETKPAIDINKFSIVFCIGRGVKRAETRDKIYKLAEKCGAGIVGTRAVVEEQIVEKERQVGQSGKSISPKIYVGFGVSGASQHMVGIKNAGSIIAINNDQNAAIFDYADFSIIENIEDVVDEMEKILCVKDLPAV